MNDEPETTYDEPPYEFSIPVTAADSQKVLAFWFEFGDGETVRESDSRPGPFDLTDDDLGQIPK